MFQALIRSNEVQNDGHGLDAKDDGALERSAFHQLFEIGRFEGF